MGVTGQLGLNVDPLFLSKKVNHRHLLLLPPLIRNHQTSQSNTGEKIMTRKTTNKDGLSDGRVKLMS